MRKHLLFYFSAIAFEFGRSGADEVSMQAFTLDINTFPGKMEASGDGQSSN